MLNGFDGGYLAMEGVELLVVVGEEISDDCCIVDPLLNLSWLLLWLNLEIGRTVSADQVCSLMQSFFRGETTNNK